MRNKKVLILTVLLLTVVFASLACQKKSNQSPSFLEWYQPITINSLGSTLDGKLYGAGYEGGLYYIGKEGTKQVGFADCNYFFSNGQWFRVLEDHFIEYGSKKIVYNDHIGLIESDEDNLYVARGESHRDGERICVFARNTGEKLWEFTPQEKEPHFPDLDYHFKVQDGALLYLGCRNGTVYAVNKKDGKIEWSHDFSGFIFSPPVKWGEKLYVGGEKGLYCLDLKSQAVKWNFRTEVLVLTSPKVIGDKIIVLDQFGGLFNLDFNGNLQWRIAKLGDGEFYFPPVIRGKNIYIASTQAIYCVGVTGDIKWKQSLAAKITSAPMVDGDHLYVTSELEVYSFKL